VGERNSGGVLFLKKKDMKTGAKYKQKKITTQFIQFISFP
jgi:hypothetical protein